MILRLSRNFRLIWIGQVVSVIGDGMQRVALLWWARQFGGNGLLTAVALSTIIPAVLCSPLGGWLADRFDRRHLMMTADLGRLALTTALAVSLLMCVLIALSSTCAAVFDPTYSAVVPTLIDSEHRAAANGLNMANSAVGGLVGPLVGGVLISLFDVGSVMVINAVTFAWSAIFIGLASVPKPLGATTAARERHSTIDAMMSIVRDRELRRLVGLASVLNMVAAPVPLLVVALAIDRFRVGAAGYGMLEVMVSVGVLAGSLMAGKVAKGAIAGPMLLTGFCLASAGLVPIAVTATAFIVGGFAIAIANTSLITSLQNVVAPEVQGRVFGTIGALGEGLRPAGLALGAPLLAGLGVSGAFMVVGGGVVVATLIWGPHVGTPRPTSPLAADQPARLHVVGRD
jgi:DHA3 family macrolide efflux protein-like MFS transporter